MNNAKRKVDLIIPRELGVLDFNARVLDLAKDLTTPILERLRFICIISNNLDEFFEILVARLKTEINQQPISHQDNKRLLDSISQRAINIVEEQYRILNQQIIPELEGEKIFLKKKETLSEKQFIWIEEYFSKEVKPVLTPIGIDPAHPFPRVLNKSLNFAVELQGTDAFNRELSVAIVQVPRSLPRIVEIPKHLSHKCRCFMTLSSILHTHMKDVFPGINVIESYQFRVTRNSELFVNEEEVTNLRDAVKGELSYRQYGASVRLETSKDCPKKISNFLLKHLGLKSQDLYAVDGPVNLVRLISLTKQINQPNLEFPIIKPGIPKQLLEDASIFNVIDKTDVLLHHPYQSFSPVLDFLDEAAGDPSVVAIKQTVYRTGANSTVMKKLIKAAQNGKQVTVAVELLARFDEETNYDWARQLEDAGVTVVYGVVGFKTHAKMLLVLRKVRNSLKFYCHIGTGNYNPVTSEKYTDLAIMTSDQDLGSDINNVFTQLTGVGKNTLQRKIWSAPFSLREKLEASIERETRHAKEGKKSGITAKINALTDETIIDKLYEASQAGVKIDLIVRGACALRSGIKGLSDNIKVRSILGRFLEHSRVFLFSNDGKNEVYIGSADWMTRNMDGRVEVCFPVTDPSLKKRIIQETLKSDMRDNLGSWQLTQDHSYIRKKPGEKSIFSAQQYNIDKLCLRSTR